MSSKTLNISEQLNNNIELNNNSLNNDYKEKVLQYIKLITTEDEKLIDMENIYKKGHQFINKYKTIYLPYLENLKSLTEKYYNRKKYVLEMEKKVFTVKNIKDDSVIKSIDKPKIKTVSTYLRKAKNIIQRERGSLAFKYRSLLEAGSIDKVKLSKFNTKRQNFINKLNEYYSIQYYFNRINLTNNNFELILVPTFENEKIFYNEKLITKEKYKEKIETDKDIRREFMNLESDRNSIKEYIKHKMNVENKNVEKLKKHIDIIVLEKDLINNFTFFGGFKKN